MFYLSAAYIVKTMISGGNLLKEYIEERAVAIANYIIDYNATVRQTARKFGISKSTVHKDDGVIIRIEFQGMRKAPVLRV